MVRYLFRRTLSTIPVLLGISFLVFALAYLPPGARPGLESPWYLRYLAYMGGLVRGDLGRSTQLNRPVTELLGERFGTTLLLTLCSCGLALLVSLPLGAMAAARRSSFLDSLAKTFSLIGVSLPGFCLGLLLVLFFGPHPAWLPVRGLPANAPFPALRHMILPSITLGAALAGVLTSFTRSSVLGALDQDYTRTARAKGQDGLGVLFRHALPNAMPVVLPAFGRQFGPLLGGAVITEAVFSLPGLGMLTLDAVKSQDLPLLQGALLAFALSTVAVMLLTDLLYALADPRIRHE